MNAFAQASQYEKKSWALVGPFIERHWPGTKVTEARSREAQLKYDRVMTWPNGKVWTLECKAEWRGSVNFFLEEWSNKALGRRGWMSYCEAEVLAYHFLEPNVLYLFSLQELKEWFWGKGLTKGVHEKYPLREQKKYKQDNDTWGRLVPIETVRIAVPRFFGPFNP